LRSRAPGLHSWLLGGVVLLAAALRLWGVAWQLPDQLNHDELRWVISATGGPAGLGEEAFDYRNPSLFRHLLELEYRLLPLPGRQPVAEAGLPDRDLLAPRMLLARLTAALLGAGTVGLLYLVGQRGFGPGTGLLAGALLAVNFLHVHLSHYGLNDALAAFFLVAALVPSVGLLRRPGRAGLLLAGLLGGLATAAKYNYAIVLVVPLVAWVVRSTEPAAPREPLRLGLPLLGLGALLGLLVGMPEIVWASGEVREGVLRQAQLADQHWIGQPSEPSLLLYGKTLAHAFGLPALAAAAAGLAILERGRSAAGLALAAAPLAYLAFMAGKALFFARFALPLVPFVCLFAAYGLVWICTRPRAFRSRAALAAVACGAALVPPAVLSVKFDLLTGQVDTRVMARQWIRANVPPGTRLAAQTFTLPNNLEGDELPRSYGYIHFGGLPDPQSFAELACEQVRYVLVSDFQEERQRRAHRGGSATGLELLRRRGQLVTTFRPGPDASGVSQTYDDVGLPFWEIMRRARSGPTVRLYALSPESCAA
jgi:hypothetical protein